MLQKIQDDILQDLEERIRLLSEIFSRLMNLMNLQLNQQAGALQRGEIRLPWVNTLDVAKENGWGELLELMWKRLSTDPLAFIPQQIQMTWDLMFLWQHTTLRMLGWSSNAVGVPHKTDKRFKSDEWQNILLFDAIKQAYLIASRHILDAAGGSFEGMPEESRRRIVFYTRHFVDALSPSNFLLTNPDVLGLTHKSLGKNLLQGLNHLLQDMEEGGGHLQVRMTDTKAFTLGENIASTPGKVIFQNHMFQLIQYTPLTTKVFARPLLIIPPWINKYYILDLQQKTSFVHWALSQGHSVFVISWVNPDESMSDVSFENYLREGVIAAIKAIERQTGADKINAIGYCLGGTLLAMTLAWLAKGQKKAHPIASATFFTTLIDFSEPGDLAVYLDERRISSLEKKMFDRGFLDGSEMAACFNMLRANDLIWSFVVNNYLLGKMPFPFDLLYWNSDSTRMPARMHSEYLRNMYLHNRLKEPDAMTVAESALDIRRIKVPTCFVSTIEDHIAPWKSTYMGARLMQGTPPYFILGGSGHIAGIINPPITKKYGYWIAAEKNANKPLPQTAEAWFAAAENHEGSWWSEWHRWVSSQDSKQVKAWHPDQGKLKPLQDAPGDYVRKRYSHKDEGAPAVKPPVQLQEAPRGKKKYANE